MAFNHKINCAFRRAHLLLVVSLLTFSVLPAYAKETTFTREELKPFNVPKVQDIPACKYVRGGGWVETSAPKPQLFANVKAIYLLTSRVDNGLPELKTLPFFQPDNLALLAACTLHKRLQTKNSRGEMVSSKPIYIPSRTTPLSDWAEAQDSNNLFVWVEAGLRDRIYQNDIFPQKVVILHVRYFRPHVHDIDSLRHQSCAIPFSYVDDQDALHRLLTSAMRVCLYQPYVSRCMSIEDCPKQKQGDAK